MTETASTYSIPPQAIRLSFFRVNPSLEDPNEIVKLARRIRGQAFRVLGAYDVMIMTRLAQRGEHIWLGALDEFFDLPGAVHAQNVLTFPLTSDGRPISRRLPAVSVLVFLKLNVLKSPDRLSRYMAAIKWISREAYGAWKSEHGISQPDDAVEVESLGEFRWHEFALILSGPPLTEILQFKMWLRRQLWSRVPGNDDSAPMVRSTYTLPMVSYDEWRGGKLGAYADERLPTEIALDLEPGNEKNCVRLLRKGMSKIFPEDGDHDPMTRLTPSRPYRIFHSLGRHDLLITFPNVPPKIGQVLQVIDQIRVDARNKTGVLATRTTLSIPDQVPDVPSEVESSEASSTNEENGRDAVGLWDRVQPDPELADTLAETWKGGFSATNPEPLSAFTNATTAHNIYRLEKIESTRFLDMSAFTPRIAANLSTRVKAQEEKDPVKRREYWRRVGLQVLQGVESYWAGLLQRSAGGQGELSRSADIQLSNRSGFNRILSAAETIAHYTTSQILQDRWHGFLLVGDQYSRTSYGVITIPRRNLFSPRWWWQVAHEAVYDYAVRNRLLSDMVFGSNEGTLTEEERRVLSTPQPVPPDPAWLIQYLLLEIFCELVVLRAVFQSDMRFYALMKWGAIHRSGEGDIPRESDNFGSEVSRATGREQAVPQIRRTRGGG